MIGFDTNVLVRFMLGDDEEQFARAAALVRRETRSGRSVLISLVVLLETEWVLRSRYQLSKAEIAAALSALLDAADLEIEDEASIEEALHTWKDSSADFADCLIGARYRRLGCTAICTFDEKASRLPGFVAS